MNFISFINRWCLPLLALSLLLYSIIFVNHSGRELKAEIIEPPAMKPFALAIAGSGIIEPCSQIIKVSTPYSGIIRKNYIQVGDDVIVGQPLFSLDDQPLQARLATAEARIKTHFTQIKICELEAENAASQFSLYDQINDARAISTEEYLRRKLNWQVGIEKLELAKRELKLTEAEFESIKIELEQLTVCSPLAGKVLQMNIRPGEFASAGNSTNPLVCIGNVEFFYVRAQIDESEISQFHPSSSAIGFIKGNPHQPFPLQFKYIEPLVIPKYSLTGSTRERVDTRIFEVVYQIEIPRGWKLHAGQQMDIFIEKTDNSIYQIDNPQ